MKVKQRGRGRPKNIYSFSVEQGRKTHHTLVHTYLNVIDEFVKDRDSHTLSILVEDILKDRVDYYRSIPNKDKEELNKLEEWKTILKYGYKSLYEIKHNCYLIEGLRMKDEISFLDEINEALRTTTKNENGSYSISFTTDIQSIYIIGVPLDQISNSGNANVELSRDEFRSKWKPRLSIIEEVEQDLRHNMY